MVQIYALLDPITQQIRYIGKTKTSLNRRLNQHLCSQNLSRRSHTTNWIKSLKLKKLRPEIKLVERVSFDNWEEREKYWINYFKLAGIKLTNTTAGGESGCLGYKHTQEAKDRISLLNSRPKTQEWIENAAEQMRKTVGKPILQYTLEQEFVREWDSFCFAAKSFGDNYKAKIKNIHACCKGKRKSAYNFIWKYKDIELRNKEFSS